MVYQHVHTHSEYSKLDGLSTCQELAERAAGLGHDAVALTDHETVAGHTDFQRECDKAGVKPVFGIETYFVEDRTRRGIAGDKDDQKAARESSHLVLLAMDGQGLRDLWALSTEAFRTGFYWTARTDWELLEQYGGHLIATTACLGGVISQMLADGRHEEAAARLKRLYGIFGDRLYLEVQGNEIARQAILNVQLAAVSRISGTPLVAASDSHYPRPEDAAAQELWLACQTRPDSGDYWHLIHMQDEEEAARLLGHLEPGEVQGALRNSAELLGRCDARITGSQEPPVYAGSRQADGELLLSNCLARWDRMTRGRAHRQSEYIRRFEREMDLLVRAGYCGYYNMVADYCDWERSQGFMIGPGRGSGGGSVVAWVRGITGIDPVEHDLLFERFLTEGRIGKSLPDFDIDFQSTRRGPLQEYVIRRYGQERVARVGTHGRYRSKGIIGKLLSVMEHERWGQAKADGAVISKIIDAAEAHTAGLGLSWDELWDQAGILLEPYAERYPEVFAMAGKLVGRLSSYGRHASGVVISPDVSLAGRLPLRLGKEDGDPMITQFGFEDLEHLGLVKCDFLTLRTLDTLQETAQLVRETRGGHPPVEEWTEQYQDPLVWDLICSGRTLGLFQIETSLCARTCVQMQPRSLADLAALVSVIRPGPRSSGLMDSYLARRAGREEPVPPDPRLKDVLAATHGVVIFQEDVMACCTVLAGFTLAEADDVRRVLGKKKVSEAGELGERFIAGCMRNGLGEDDAKSLWDKLAEFSRYSFGRAHAFGYAVLAYWSAWEKAHYLVEFYTRLLSTVPQDRCPAVVREAQVAGIRVLPPDISESGRGFLHSGLVIRYGLESVKGIGDAAVSQILAGRPYLSWEDFAVRKGSAVHAGVVLLLAKCGALDSILPVMSGRTVSRSGLVAALEYQKTDLGSRDCAFSDMSAPPVPGWPDACRYDWMSEPPPLSEKTGRPLKLKDPPRKCTRACRQYSPPPQPDFAALDPYIPAQVRALEHETLGIWLSSTPFDDLDPADREYLRGQAEVMLAGPAGEYRIAAVVRQLRLRSTRAGQPIAFVTLEPEAGDEFEAVVFADQLGQLAGLLTEGTLILARIARKMRSSPEGPQPAHSIAVAMKVA